MRGRLIGCAIVTPPGRRPAATPRLSATVDVDVDPRMTAPALRAAV